MLVCVVKWGREGGISGKIARVKNSAPRKVKRHAPFKSAVGPTAEPRRPLQKIRAGYIRAGSLGHKVRVYFGCCSYFLGTANVNSLSLLLLLLLLLLPLSLLSLFSLSLLSPSSSSPFPPPLSVLLIATGLLIETGTSAPNLATSAG